MAEQIKRATFEIHLTVGPFDPSERETARFTKFCQTHKLKPIYVGVLYTRPPAGPGFKRFLQTSEYLVGSFASAQNRLQETSNLLEEEGFLVLRRKIETTAASMAEAMPILPLSEDKTQWYYETHIVLKLDEEYLSPGPTGDLVFKPLEKMKKVIALNHECNANLKNHHLYIPLSFNMKYKQQCFITVRSYGCPRAEADAYVSSCLQKIEQNFEIIKTIREAVVYDDNARIDSELVLSDG
jgi:hypothetical protein